MILTIVIPFLLIISSPLLFSCCCLLLLVQAVLVFLSTDWLYCRRVGGMEMCFTRGKFWSLVTVVSGVVLFSVVTKPKEEAAVESNNNKHHHPVQSPDQEDDVTEASTLLSATPTTFQAPFAQQYTL